MLLNSLLGKTKFGFSLALHYFDFVEDRRRLGKKPKKVFFVCFSLALHYFGFAEDRRRFGKKTKKVFFVWFSTHLALSLHQMKTVRPKKNLGQHFLVDLNIAKAIADTVDACPDIPVLEVGPGMGVLTQYLIEKPRPLRVVEIDKESVAFLKEHFPQLEQQIIGDDFLRMDLSALFDGQPFVLTGNYPYDISSQIFFKMLDYKDYIPCCTGMIQHEVAQRIASQPGNKAYGILSVMIQAWYDVEYLFMVDEHVFNPPPKVKSAVIRMTRNNVEHLGCDERLFRTVVKTVFNQRRKMLRVSLRQLFTKGTVAPDFFENEMMTMRPEQLTIPQFVELTNLVAQQMEMTGKT